MARVVRRILIRAVRYFILRPATAIVLVLAVVVIGLVVFVLPSFTGQQGFSLPGGLSLGLALPHASGEPQSTSDFLRGNQSYDAQMMWGSLSPDAQQRLTSGGNSLQTLQQQMDAAQQQGVRVQDVTYIGGKSLADGSSAQFYLVSLQPSATADVQYVPYMFTVGPDGKIDKVQ